MGGRWPGLRFVGFHGRCGELGKQAKDLAELLRAAGSVITPSVPMVRCSTGIRMQADSTMSAPV